MPTEIYHDILFGAMFFLYSVKSLENRLAFFQYLISIVARQKNDFLF